MMNQLLKSRPPNRRPTTGMMRSFTSAPTITPTARSTTLPRIANARNSLMNDISASVRRRCGCLAGWILCLHRRFARLTRADAHRLLDFGDEDLAVADLAGARRLDDRLDRPIHEVLRHDDLDFDLGQKIDDVFGAAIELRVTLLPAEALDLGHGQAAHADVRQRFA